MRVIQSLTVWSCRKAISKGKFPTWHNQPGTSHHLLPLPEGLLSLWEPASSPTLWWLQHWVEVRTWHTVINSSYHRKKLSVIFWNDWEKILTHVYISMWSIITHSGSYVTWSCATFHIHTSDRNLSGLDWLRNLSVSHCNIIKIFSQLENDSVFE